jgi:PAS domain S-box-containing protein
MAVMRVAAGKATSGSNASAGFEAEKASLDQGAVNLRALLMALPEAVVVHVDNRIELVNRAAQVLFGMDETALLKQPPTRVVHADSVKAVRDYLTQLRRGIALAPLAGVRIVRPNGELRIVEIVGTPLKAVHLDAHILIVRDVTDLHHARSELAASHGELQRLLAARDRIQEAERQRIARELHDDLQQPLAAILIDVNAAAHRHPVEPDVRLLLEGAGNLAANSIESTRRIINDLRPQMLEDLGLLPALEALVSQFQRVSGVDCRLQVSEEPSEDDEPISSQVATCLYRVTQEGLQNISRHANATNAEVSFSRMQRGLILLRITDNGRGMRTDQPRSAESFGLIGMRERVRALGALLRLDSCVGSGTTISVVVPAAIAASSPGLEAIHGVKRRQLTVYE